jgi:hypothetical protein
VLLDESGRYALTQLNESTLWRYDRRWRGVAAFQPHGDAAVRVIEGTHHFLVVHQSEPGGEIEVTVRPAAAPEVVLATGRFVDAWHFEGDSQAFGKVPDYVLVEQSDGSPALLRIADDAEIDALEGFDSVVDVAHVPDSRLVVISGVAAYTVYDPAISKAIRHFELAGGNPTPMMGFRNGEELWMNDTDTMLKIETRQFEVQDAAGSQIDASVDPETAEPLGRFGRWTFAAGNELCVVTRPEMGDVLVLDGVSMLPVARGIFDRSSPFDAVLSGRNSIVAVDARGKALRTRLRRVKIHFEDAPGPGADAESS